MEAILSRHFADPDPADLRAYRDAGGYVGLARAVQMDPADIIAELEKSGLRGCGGAGFPTGLKWRLRGVDAPEPRYLVCNLDETEPGSIKDRALLFGAPHHILEGMFIAAHALGVRYAVVFVRGEYAAGARVLEKALYQAREAGLMRLPDGDLRLDIHVSLGRYICGEDSAILNAIEGKRANPRKNRRISVNRGSGSNRPPSTTPKPLRICRVFSRMARTGFAVWASMAAWAANCTVSAALRNAPVFLNCPWERPLRKYCLNMQEVCCQGALCARCCRVVPPRPF